MGDLENFILSEVREWQILYDIHYIWNLGNNINGSTQSRNRVTDMESKLRVIKGESKETRSKLRVWDWQNQAMVYLRPISTKNSLYRIGNSISYLVRAYNGNISEENV